ncbi:MAG: dUTP diphosphatase [Deltaproteobacteria bacterium]|nr:MAG: dUTP diphosphatase [Deltaproteobacteria bacterium]
MKIKLKQLDPDLPIPKYAHEDDAGCDLYSRIDLVLKPGERALMPTGIQLAVPAGYAGFIQPRSGIALSHGISIVNSPGIIDSSYRGEIKVILINLDKKNTFRLKRGEKLCQLIIQKVEKADFEVVEELDSTIRGEGGFGSSGFKE